MICTDDHKALGEKSFSARLCRGALLAMIHCKLRHPIGTREHRVLFVWLHDANFEAYNQNAWPHALFARPHHTKLEAYNRLSANQCREASTTKIYGLAFSVSFSPPHGKEKRLRRLKHSFVAVTAVTSSHLCNFFHPRGSWRPSLGFL